MGWLGRQGIGLVCALTYGGAAEAAPSDTGPEPVATERRSRTELAVRGAAEWGILSAPIWTNGEYRRADGSANLEFDEWAMSRELFAGRLEVGAGIPLPQGLGVFPRGALVFGSSPVEVRSLTVAAVPIEYGSQQMFFALSLGAEFQFIERLLGVGLDFGWAGSWDAGRPSTPSGLELTRYTTSGPYARISASARLPWTTPWGIGIYGAADTYLSYDGWSVWTNNRTTFGAFFEWDGSR